MFTLVFAAIVLPTRASCLRAYCTPSEIKVGSLLHQLLRARFQPAVPVMSNFRRWSLPCILRSLSNAHDGLLPLPAFIFFLRGGVFGLGADSSADEFVSRDFEAASLAIRQTQGFRVNGDADSFSRSHIVHTKVYHISLTGPRLNPSAARAAPQIAPCLQGAGRSLRNRCGVPPGGFAPQASPPCRHRAPAPPPGTRWGRCPCLR